jgi:hypothetical protein
MHVSLVTKCVTGDFLQLTFNDVGRGELGTMMSGGREGGRGGWGQKVLSRPSADSFAVGRRQKGNFKSQTVNSALSLPLFRYS